MISINDLSCNALPTNSAELRALERKMIDELYAKVNYVPPKATPIDATKSHAQRTAERYGISPPDFAKKAGLKADIAKTLLCEMVDVILAASIKDADRFKRVVIVPAYRRIKQKSEILLTLAENLKLNYTLILSVLSNKTANYLRGINERIIDAMTFKNRGALPQKHAVTQLLSNGTKTIFKGTFRNEIHKRLFATT